MSMKSHLAYIALASALALSGCGGGSGGGSDAVSSAAPVPPPTSTTTAFTPFIKAQLLQTSDVAEPASVNELEWTFDEDEAAYADVLEN